MRRKIIQINEELCNGCGQCIPSCPEGALQIIEGKARLISDLFCDGLGACIGECPLGAIEIVEREAEPYDERKVMEKMIEKGPAVIAAHLKHLKEHGETKLLKEALDYLQEQGLENPLSHEEHREKPCCPSAQSMTVKREKKKETKENKEMREARAKAESHLSNWPIQLRLLSPYAPYLEQADILLSADCVPFAYGNFQEDFVKDRVVIILCPKLDENIDGYIDKLSEIIKINRPRSITVLHMEVPCCFGIVHIAREAIKKAGVNVELKDVMVRISGEAVTFD